MVLELLGKNHKELMNSFHRYIAVNKEVLKFEFTEVSNPSQPKFFVRVTRGDEHVTSFEMKRNYARWEIVPPAPGWITEIRLQLSAIIEDLINES